MILKSGVSVFSFALLASCQGDRISPAISAISCEDISAALPASLGEQDRIRFVNKSNGYRVIARYKIAKDLNPDLPVSASENFEASRAIAIDETLSFLGKGPERWMITDGPGNCLTILNGPLGSDYSITIANQYFEDE